MAGKTKAKATRPKLILASSATAVLLFLILLEVGARLALWAGVSPTYPWYSGSPFRPDHERRATFIATQAKLGLFPPIPAWRRNKYLKRNLDAPEPEYEPRVFFGPYRSLPFKIPKEAYQQSRRTADGSLIYDVNVAIDWYGRRITPEPRRSRNADEFLLFTGCSYAFGEGVAGNETLPYVAAEAAPRYRSYNYAVPGGSIGEAVHRLKVAEPEEIAEKTGWAVYVYMYTHLARLTGAMSITGRWGWYRPYFFESPENGELVTSGSFEDFWPIRTSFYRWIQKSAFANLTGLDYPVAPRDDEWRIFMRGLKHLDRLAVSKFKARGLVVLVFPNTPTFPLLSYLEEYGIRYVDFSEWSMEMITQGEAHFSGDGHPTPETYRILGKAFAQALEDNRDRPTWKN